MHPFSNIAKRVLLASSIVLLAACGSNGITDPTGARKSGYLTVSATVAKPTSSGYNVPAVIVPSTSSGTVKASTSGPGSSTTTSLGYNVPAN
jgi:hypothetical protein